MGQLESDFVSNQDFQYSLEDDKVEGMLVHVFGVKMPADILFPTPYSKIAEEKDTSTTQVDDQQDQSRH
jgi:hypothetical protein